jgi:hypothetical protein
MRWLALNLLLDFRVLVPISGVSVPDDLAEIGSSCLLLPIIAVSKGTAALRSE